jgi:hypothetical protein
LNPALPIDQRVDDLISRMTVEEKASQFSSTSPAVPRLQIPAYNWWSEALHGVANQGTATVFPQAVGLGATFDEPLILKMATVISTEARAKYHDYERRQQVAASSGASLPGSGGGIRVGAEARRLTGRTHSSPASSALPLFAACRATTRNTSRPSPRPSTTPCTVAPNRRGTPST